MKNLFPNYFSINLLNNLVAKINFYGSGKVFWQQLQRQQEF